MRKSFICLVLLILSSCDEGNLFNPNLYIPESSELQNMIKCKIIAKDSVLVYSSENAYLAGTYFHYIIFGQLDPMSNFSPVDTIVPKYQKINDKYLINFSFSFKAPKSCVTYQLETKFYLNADDFKFTITTIELYKYPFPSAQLFLDFNEVPGYPDKSNVAFAQGFDIRQNEIYYQLSGGYGVYKYKLGSNNSDLVYGAPGGDWLTLHNSDLYIDVFHYIIGKFDLNSGEMNLDFIRNEDWEIRGMAFRSDTLFVLNVKNLTVGPCYLARIDIDGNVLSNEYFYTDGWSMTIYGDDIYTWTFTDILKYNIPTKQFETIYSNLDRNIESINIVGDRFYYSDADKRIICYLTLSDFFGN